MRTALIGLPAMACAACGTTNEVGAMEDFKQQAINQSPYEREIAASTTFYFCADHPNPDRFVALCEVCNVDLYADKDLPFNADPDTDAPIVGVKGWATHFYHEFKPWGDDPKPRVSVTGERASERFATNTMTVEAIEALFSEANAWCTSRRDGDFQVQKNEIAVFVEGLPS
ncbi:MAG: hypothetical protein ACX94B_09700 [Henriciella sp.]